MIKQLLAIFMIALVINLVVGKVAMAQTEDAKSNKKINEIKTKVNQIGTGEKAKIKLELYDKTKLKGIVTTISEDSFTIKDKKTGAITQIEYAQVNKVSRDGFWSKGNIIAISGIAAGAGIILGIYLSIYCNEQSC